MASRLNRLQRYWRLPRAERHTLGRAALVMAMARFLVGIAGVPRTRRAAFYLSPLSLLPVERISELVAVAARGLPGTTPCLARAITLEAVLVRAGHAAELRIGLAPRRGADRLEAHAWVEVDGRALDPEAAGYAAVPLFGVRG